MKKNLIERLQNPLIHIYFNTFLLIAAVIGWPVTALTIFKEEPQGILGLSWAAIIISCIGTLLTAVVELKQEKSN